jgi:TonB-dependent receptor
MNKSRTADANRTREPESKGRRHQEQGQGALPGWRLVSQVGLVSLARLAPLAACAGVLAIAAPAGAQEPAAPAPETTPPEATPPAAPPPSEAAPVAAAAAPEAAPPAAPEPGAEAAPEDVSADSVIDEGLPEVVITTGYRRSLGAALERKQASVAQVDAIVAEDIADFPDLNLAESLQRIPGIAITRAAGGEGGQITVRGLGGLYTRVRVNGMEARSNIGNNATNNGGRTFDFNLFASELFNSIVVHKTATADLDEGSLGAVVDLNTARPFDYKAGWTFVLGAQAAYNDLSDTVRPRLTGLLGYRDPGGIWGATLSAAYTRIRYETASTDSQGWVKAPFRSVNGVICAENPDDASCAEVNDAFHPRIPRLAQDVITGDRLGLTAGVQLRPSHRTDIHLDGLYATYPTRTEQRRLFPLIRNNEGQMDITNYSLQTFPDRYGQGNDSLISADVGNAWIRSEHVRLQSEARFYQVSLSADHSFTDDIYAKALIGTSRSKSGLPHDTTVNYDNRNYGGYRFDFTNDKTPLLAFTGADVNDPATFVVPELRDRVGTIEGGFDTAELNLHWRLLDELKLAAGTSYKRSTFEYQTSNRDGTVCGLGLYDCDTDDDGMDDVLGPPGDPALTESVKFPGGAAPGTNTRWASPSIDGWVNAFDYYNAPFNPDQNGTTKVVENNLGFYLQGRGEIMLGADGMRLQYDAGLRYVETRQESSGLNTGVFVDIKRPTYRDWLPSANTALWFNDQLVLRLAAARVMARPALNNLSPGGTADPVNFTVNYQNPYLNPTRATALDASIEWYFSGGSILSLAGFFKDIKSFPIQESRRGTFASTGLPTSVLIPLSPGALNQEPCGDPAGCWDITTLTDGPGATVQGLEIGFQAPFSAFHEGLPLVIRSMGLVANYTYVDSTANYDFFGNNVTERLLGLSNGSYNATLYYDDSKFSARVSLAYRSDYLLGGPNQNSNLWQWAEASTRVDFSSSYNVTDYLKVSLEGLNVTDNPFSSRYDVTARRRSLYNTNGRTFLLGARLSL